MAQSKKGFLPVLQGVRLSKTQCPTTAEDREKMKDVPYASVEHQDRHHAVVLTELFPDTLLDRSPGIVIELNVCSNSEVP